MTGDVQQKTLETLKASGVIDSLKRHEVTGESTALPLHLSADDRTANGEHKSPLAGASSGEPSVHAQRATMIVRVEELLTSYGLDPNKKPELLAALDRLHTAHTNAEILAAIANVSSIVTAAETSLPDIASPMTFADFEKKFDAAWSKYDQLEKETRTTMEEAARAGYISKEDEDRSKQEQKEIEENKKAIDKLRADNQNLPDGVEKKEAQEEIKNRTRELSEEIIEHANRDKALIEQAIKMARRDHNYTLAKDLEEALPKKDKEVQAGTELYDLGMSSAMDKRRTAVAKMKADEQRENSDVNAGPTNNSTAAETRTATDDLPIAPPKPTAFTAADASHGSLGALSPSSTGTISKPNSNGIT